MAEAVAQCHAAPDEAKAWLLRWAAGHGIEPRPAPDWCYAFVALEVTGPPSDSYGWTKLVATFAREAAAKGWLAVLRQKH